MKIASPLRDVLSLKQCILKRVRRLMRKVESEEGRAFVQTLVDLAQPVLKDFNLKAVYDFGNGWDLMSISNADYLIHLNQASDHPTDEDCARPKSMLNDFGPIHDFREFRFEIHVVPCKTYPGDCWNWLGTRQKGYASYWENGKRKYLPVHRLVCELNGQNIEGLDVHHLCENKRCCNPDHLFPTTRTDHLRYFHDNLGVR